MQVKRWEPLNPFKDKCKPKLSSPYFMQPITLSKRQNLDSSNVKEFADYNLKFDEKFSKRREKTLWEKEKLLVTSIFSFSYSVFKKLLLHTLENQGLFGKGLNFYVINSLPRDPCYRLIA